MAATNGDYNSSSAVATKEILNDLEEDYLFDLFYSRFIPDYKMNAKMSQNLRSMFGLEKERDSAPLNWKAPQNYGLSNSEKIIKQGKDVLGKAKNQRRNSRSSDDDGDDDEDEGTFCLFSLPRNRNLDSLNSSSFRLFWSE